MTQVCSTSAKMTRNWDSQTSKLVMELAAVQQSMFVSHKMQLHAREKGDLQFCIPEPGMSDANTVGMSDTDTVGNGMKP